MRRRRGEGRARLGAVLFTDIVDSTRIAAELGNRRWASLLARHHEVVRREIRRLDGREHDTAGDGFFVTFERPVDAIRCAAEAVKALRSLGIEIRAGVAFGELEPAGTKVGGLIVNIAARVMSVAASGEILVPASVREIVPGTGIAFDDHGVHRLKGLDEELRLYRVASIDGVSLAEPLAAAEAAERRRELVPRPERHRRTVVMSAIVATAIAAVTVTWTLVSGDEPPAGEVAGPFLVELDPERGVELQRIETSLPRRPREVVPTSRTMVAGQGAVWILAPTNPEPMLIHVDPVHGDVRDPIRVKFTFSLSIVSAFETVWVLTAERLMRVNPGTDEIRVVLEIPAPEAGSSRASLASDRQHLWIGRTDGILMRVDPSGTISRERKVADSVDLIAVGEGSAWIADQVAGIVTRVDPGSLRPIGRIEAPGNVDRMLVSDGSLWILDRATGLLTRISSLTSDPVRAQATVGEGATDMAAGFGSIWVAHDDGRVSRVDVLTLRVDAEFAHVDGAATAIAVDPTRGSIWVDVGHPVEEGSGRRPG